MAQRKVQPQHQVPSQRQPRHQAWPVAADQPTAGARPEAETQPRRRVWPVAAAILAGLAAFALAAFGTVWLVKSIVYGIFGVDNAGQDASTSAMSQPTYSLADTQDPTSAQAYYTSPYNAAYMTYDNGRFAYEDSEGGWTSQTGIDVSDHQGSIDWNAVTADGVEFAMIRIGWRGYTEGGIQPDEAFEYNYQAARDAGLEVGVYFFSQALTEEEAVEEAEYVLAVLDGRDVDLCIAFDEEPIGGQDGRANGLSSQQLQANAQAFCRTIADAGYETMVYGNAVDLSGVDWQSTGLAMWLAQYDEPFPLSWFDVTMWQYTSSGKVDGITTNVDMNLLFCPVDA